MITVSSNKVVYDPELCEGKHGGINTVQGTGITLYLEYGENENHRQIFKRVRDKDKNIVGEYSLLTGLGYVGNKKNLDICNWAKEIKAVTKISIF